MTTLAYTEKQVGPLPYREILGRVEELQGSTTISSGDRTRIRAIMDGGTDGIRALLGDKVKGIGEDIPAPNLLASGVERLAQKLGNTPNVRCDPPGDRDSEPQRKRATKRERIVEGYDEICQMEMQLPQVGRWLPGYGFAVWTIKEKRDRAGNPYPFAELRDPYDCYPGNWGPSQQPEEMAIVRLVPQRTLVTLFPQFKRQIVGEQNGAARGGIISTNPNRSGWENQSGNGLQVVEYFNSEGTWVCLPERGLVVDYIPNPLESGPRFVVAKRFSFNQLQSQYKHVIGLMSQMAKINVLEMIAMEDSTFTETNIIGEPTGKKYQRGRFAVNVFPPGTQVQKPVNQVPYQMFQSIDRAERYLRLGSAYPVTDDTESPVRWASGRGLQELAAAGGLHIAEYQKSLKWALQDLDSKRLEWDEQLYGGRRKPMPGIEDTPNSEQYRPSSDISGALKTRRVYGAMAGFDDAVKVGVGLQLMAAGVMDTRTLQENLSGLENLPQIRERIIKDEAEKGLLAMLSQQAAQGEPKAQMAFVEIHATPSKIEEILAKYFTPEEPQMTPEEEAMIAQQMQAQQSQFQAPAQPPSVQTALSRLEASGNASGGIQTVRQM